jgi:hypothetical protein
MCTPGCSWDLASRIINKRCRSQRHVPYVACNLRNAMIILGNCHIRIVTMVPAVRVPPLQEIASAPPLLRPSPAARPATASASPPPRLPRHQHGQANAQSPDDRALPRASARAPEDRCRAPPRHPRRAALRGAVPLRRLAIAGLLGVGLASLRRRTGGGRERRRGLYGCSPLLLTPSIRHSVFSTMKRLHYGVVYSDVIYLRARYPLCLV